VADASQLWLQRHYRGVRIRIRLHLHACLWQRVARARLADGRDARAAARLEIYTAFLLLLIAYFSLVWVVGGGSRYLDETNTGFFFKNPGAAIVHAAVMQYAPVNTDMLPTFVLLHLAFPGLLWLLARSATIALAASFLLYLMVQVFSWHIPAWPSGELYFNPLAWQVLFVFGAWYAYEGAGRLRTVVQSRRAGAGDSVCRI
jgi:hypothetical protein